jgi:hypothetical protein
MKEIDNKIKRRIGALLILGILGAIVLNTSVTADLDNLIWNRDDTNNDVSLSASYPNYDVGIGTDDPSTKLHVVGGVTIDSGDLNVDSGTLFVDESANRVGIGDTSPDFKLEVTGSSGDGYFGVSSTDAEGNNGDVFIIDSSGDVSIGYATPLAKLYVLDTDTTSSRAGLYVSQGGAISGGTGYGIMTRKTGASQTNVAGHFMARDATTNYGIISYATTGSSTTNIGGYFSASSATNNYGLLVENGDVGIGTTTPINKLDINGAVSIGTNYAATYTAPSDGLLVEGDVCIGKSTPFSGYKLSIEDLTPSSNGLYVKSYNIGGVFEVAGVESSKTYIAWGDYGIYQYTGTKNFFVGNIGIGDNSPGAHLVVGSDTSMGIANGIGDAYILNDLEVDGNMYMANSLVATQSWVTSQGFITKVGSMASGDAFADSTADGEWLGLGSSGGLIEFYLEGANPDEVNIKNARVGIGTSDPDTLLHLSGDTSSGALFTLEPSESQYGEPRIDFITDTDGYGMTIKAVDSNRALHFYDNTPTGLEGPSLTITDVGTVGIGQDRPLKLLHIGDDTRNSGEIRLESSDGDLIDIGITTDDVFYIDGGTFKIDNTGETKGLGMNLDTYHKQTLDATPTIISTIGTATDEAYGLRVTIIGIDGTNNDVAHYVRYVTYENQDGTLTEHSETNEHTYEDSNWDVSIQPVDTDIIIKVTGAASTTIQWQATVEMNIVGV